MPNPTSPTSPQQLSNTEKLRRAVQLRRGGATFQQIADAGYYSSAATACRAVMRYHRKTHKEIAEEVQALRQEDLDRLDAMIRGLWPIATNPEHSRHLYAIDRVAKLMQQRAKLLGLEAPQQHEVTGAGGERLTPLGIDLSTLTGEQLEVVRQIMEQATNGSGQPAPE